VIGGTKGFIMVKIDLKPVKDKAYRALKQGNKKELLKAQPLELKLYVSNRFCKILRIKFNPAMGTFKLV